MAWSRTHYGGAGSLRRLIAPVRGAVHFGTCSFPAALWEWWFAFGPGAGSSAALSYGMEAPRGESLTRVCRPFIQSSGLLTRGNSGTCPNQVPSPPCLRGPHDQEWSPSWSSMNWKC
ncbi:small integral membrane protein 11 isoform X3 [Bubalus kerabau]|uniref:small integral membrane protein 11 isoform X3 n=1 Tax=Bubalus carabanensis TaxID=3119969 RepID=UPI00244ECC07|nr:small integral membrane protein 11 isoform X3 [Bubalus carabanensis]